jgi:hypothetical protein
MAVIALEYLDGSLCFIENDPTVGTLGQVRLESDADLFRDVAVNVVRQVIKERLTGDLFLSHGSATAL